jgi:hypothetical protein
MYLNFKSSHFGPASLTRIIPYPSHYTLIWLTMVDQISEIPDVFPGVHAGDLCCWQVVRNSGERSSELRRAESPTHSAQLTLLGSLGMGKDVELRTATSCYIYILHTVAYRCMPLTSTQSIWLIILEVSNHESGLRRHSNIFKVGKLSRSRLHINIILTDINILY